MEAWKGLPTPDAPDRQIHFLNAQRADRIPKLLSEWTSGKVCLWMHENEPAVQVKIVSPVLIAPEGVQELVIEIVEGPLKRITTRAPIVELFEIESP